MCKLAVLSLLVSSVFVLSSSSPAAVSKRGGFRLCGARLVETLTMICGGDFYGPDLVARDLGDENRHILDDSYPFWFAGMASPKINGADGQLRQRRQLMGVVDECCRKPCSYAVLSSYCGK